MAQPKFLVLIDENMGNGVVEGLKNRGVDAARVIDVIQSGTKDDMLLEFMYQHGYSLVTHDERIRKHIDKHFTDGKTHGGVFIAPSQFQGQDGVGRIVEFIAEYDELIKGGAASLENDVYNQIIYVK